MFKFVKLLIQNTGKSGTLWNERITRTKEGEESQTKKNPENIINKIIEEKFSKLRECHDNNVKLTDHQINKMRKENPHTM